MVGPDRSRAATSKPQRELGDCEGAYDQAEPIAPFSGLVAAAFECDCECSSNASLACEGSARLRISNPQVFEGQSPCTPGNGGPGAALTTTVSDGVPQTHKDGEIPMGEVQGATVDMVDTEVAGSCMPNPTESSSPATWTDRFLLCGASIVDGDCAEGEVCVPDTSVPYEPGVCDYRAGDERCPDGYPNRELFHESIGDTRDCSTCTCGDPSGSCTGPGMTLSLWTFFGNAAELTTLDAPNSYCQSLDLTCQPPAACTPWTSIAEVSFDPGTFVADDPSAPCPPSGGEPVGDATGADPVTICCAE